jgi:type IV pilus assembly protein PilY1
MKTSSFNFKHLLAMFFLVFQVTAHADDTDLFVGIPPGPTDLPNVLFVLDNTANWNTAFTNEMNALKSVVSALPVNADGTAKFRVGFMLFTETGGGNSGNDGGYIRVAVRDMDSATKTKYVAFLNSLDKLNDKSNGGKLGNTMADVYRYFAGAAPYSGNNKVKTDYTGNVSGGTASSNAIYAIANVAPNKNALTAKAGTQYNTPIVSGSCAHNFVIYISNGAAQDNASDTSAATTVLQAAVATENPTLSGAQLTAAKTAATTAITISPSGSQTNVGDEWARFLKKTTMNITTYTIDIDKVTTGQGPGWTALLQSMATVSSGKYFDVNSSTNSGQAIVDALNTIFSEIQSVNSVFASVSLPVSVNTQGTYLNQVYVGMFRPDATASPRWAGNLKQFKLGYINNVLSLQDADAASAINSATGFITECARSYWTPTSVDTYWAFRPLGGCLTVNSSDASNYPDGNVVDKGAQAYALRNMTSRTVKTCSSTLTSCTSLLDFNSTNVTQAALGAASTTERDALISWAKGLNPDNEGAKGTTVMRPSVHGDVVHSRPVALNFGTDVAPQIVVFYGGNDGVLRAVNGNRTGNIGTVAPGAELWAFIPPEFYPKIKPLRDNTTEIYYPGTPTVTTQAKPYAIDGPITAYQGGGNSYVYGTMRRGGRAIYGFNVTSPATPSLLWKRGCDSSGCTTGFSEIGQTWSSGKIMFSSSIGSSTPLLIMGGGYDTCEDADANTCTSASTGHKVYVINAVTGALVKALDTDRGVIADIFIVPNSDGTAHHAYAADLGGNVYRIDIGTVAAASWSITKIASFGCATTATCTSNRKFMFTPDVLDNGDGSYTLLLGSGDREKPLGSTYNPLTYAVQNKFFMFVDKPSDASWLTAELTNSVCGAAVICLNSLLPISGTTPTTSELAAKKGWALDLRSSEKVVTSAITVFNNVTFSTHIPAVATPGSCASNLGTASVYNISYKDASSSTNAVTRYEQIPGGGLPPSPVAGNVTLDNGTTVPFCIGCRASSPLEGGSPIAPGTTVQPKARVYWYIQK